MSIKGFSVNGAVQRYDYTALDNLPQGQGVSDDLKAALLQLAQKVAYIDDQGQTYYDDLYDALYPEKTLLSIAANFQQGQAVVYNTDSLDSLKQYLTVTAIYDDASTETVPSSAYTLSGTLTTGTSVITVTYEGKTDAFNVTVTAAPMSFTVTNNLTGCTTSNSATSVLENASYTAVITASSDYTLVGATVSITMGGQDITTSAYSGGIITINSVTGALVISVAAVERVLSSISAVYANESANVPISPSMRSYSYFAADFTWKAANDSYTFIVPVTTGKAYRLHFTTTDSTVAGTIFRWAFCDTDTPSGQLLSACNRSFSPQDIPDVTVKAVDSYMLIQVSAAFGDAIATNGYLEITEFTNSVFDSGTLDVLKQNLVVTANYSGGSSEILDADDYELSGSLDVGLDTITVSYGGKTATFTAVVTAPLYSIPDFAETTVTIAEKQITVAKQAGVYTVAGASSGNVFVLPNGTVSASKGTATWFQTITGKSVLNKTKNIVWSNPTGTDLTFDAKLSQADANTNIYNASFAMSKNGSGTNGEAQLYYDTISSGRNISGLCFTLMNNPGTNANVSVSFKLEFYVDGVRYL